MRDLNTLKSCADRGLAGLNAGAAMKQAIVEKAAARPAQLARQRRALALACCAVVLAVGLAVYLPGQLNAPVDQLIQTQSAGDGTVGHERADLGSNNVTVSSKVPEYSTLWGKASDGVFHLLRVDGRWYRMMTAPASVESRLLGGSLGEVAEYTDQPTLATASGIISNSAAAGVQVYTVLDGTLVAAEVSGKTRLFQRVSFNDEALIGKEKLGDTLNLSGHISSMSLSDVGTVTDSQEAERLFGILLKNAAYESAGSLSGKQSLHITLDSGLTVQLLVRGDRLAACGVWSCPEFLDAFAQSVGQ